MKARIALLAAVPLAAIAFLLLYLNLWPTRPAKLPILPSLATTPGRYLLDNDRFVEIEDNAGTIRLTEFVIPAPTGKGPQIVTYSFHEIMILKPGWSVGLRPPDTLVINDGTGTTITRDFGDPPPAIIPPGPSPGMARIIRSTTPAPEIIPIPDVETPPEDPETEDKEK